MTAQMVLTVVTGAVSVLVSILAPALIVGRYLGNILTTQAQHAKDHERHYQSARDQGERFERLGKEIAEIRGELRGRGSRS